MILIPKRGKLDNNNGSNAQWMAHKMDVAIPNASKLILNIA
ncbi:MAG: hypothetical protein ACO29O_03690 [Chitinophagaceae bacterium]